MRYTLAIIIGGDGTLSTCVDAMVKHDFDVPVYAFGRGTANDFSSFMKTNKSVRRTIKIVRSSPKIKEVDTLYVRHQHYSEGVYAINVACGGAFTNGVTKYRSITKRLFGKLAYFTRAINVSFRMKPQKMKFTVTGHTGRPVPNTSVTLHEVDLPNQIIFSEEVYLFLILNTTNAGSIKRIAPTARPWDGQLNFVAIKKCGIFARIGIMFSVLFQRPHKNKNIIQLQGRAISAEVVGEPNPNFTKTDVDGNAGDDYPVHVEINDKKIKVVSCV